MGCNSILCYISIVVGSCSLELRTRPQLLEATGVALHESYCPTDLFLFPVHQGLKMLGVALWRLSYLIDLSEDIYTD